ncbi:hypothetical protein Tco_0897403 [Tanacetum coccineum]
MGKVYKDNLRNVVSTIIPRDTSKSVPPYAYSRAVHPDMLVRGLRVVTIRRSKSCDRYGGSGHGNRILRDTSTIEKSPLDFANENPSQQITEDDETEDQVRDKVSREIPPEANPTTTGAVPELKKEVAIMAPRVNKRHHKRANDEANANAPPKVLRRDHAAARPGQSIRRGKSLASIGLEAGATFVTPATQEALLGAKSVSDPDPLSYAIPQPHLERDMAQSSNTSRPRRWDIYQPKWGVTNNYRLDTSDVCKGTVDHIVPPGYFSELRHLSNTDFLSQYNVNLALQVAMGFQLRLRFEQETRLLKKAMAKIAKRDQRIQAREEEIKKLDQEINSLRTVDTEVQGLRNQTRNLGTMLEAEAQVTGGEWKKAAFKEFNKCEDERGNSRCAEMDARLNALSIDFDEELYPHLLTAIAGHRWVIGHGLRLAVMKCVESSEIRQAFANVVSAGLAKGQQQVSQSPPRLEGSEVSNGLKDAPMELVMSSLHLESDTGEDAPQWIRDLHPSSSQLKIPVYPEGLAILLADTAAQTEISEDEASLRLLRSKSLPLMYNLD